MYLVLFCFVCAVLFLLLARSAKHHQETAHNDAAPRCVRHAAAITPERRDAVDAAWAELERVEQDATAGLVPPTQRPPEPAYRRPPWEHREKYPPTF